MWTSTLIGSVMSSSSGAFAGPCRGGAQLGARVPRVPPPGLVADAAEGLHQDVGGQVGGEPGGDVEQRVDLDEVEADHLGPLGDRGERVPKLRVAHAVRLRRDAARGERDVEHVDVDADVAARSFRDPLQDRLDRPVPEFLHGHDPVAVAQGVLVHDARVADAADADLVDGQDVGVPDVGDPPLDHLVLEELPAGLRVVVAVPIGDEPQRVLPDGAGAEPRARHEGRPFVARRAEDRDVGVETGQVLAHGRPEERGDPDERKIQAATAALTLVHPLTSSSPDAAVGYADAPPRRALPVTGGPMKDALVVVPARDARAVRVRPGGRFRVVDIEGGQVVDLFAFVADEVAEYASAEHTRVHVNRLFPRVGESFVTTRRRPTLRFEADDSPGVHDMLCAACDPTRYRLLGVDGWHPSCQENLQRTMAALGHGTIEVPQPINLFMAVGVQADGAFTWSAAPTGAGDGVVVRAELDCIVVASACPQDLNEINHYRPTPIGIELLSNASPLSSPTPPSP